MNFRLALKENIAQLKTLLAGVQAPLGWQQPAGGQWTNNGITPPSTPSTNVGRTKRMVDLF